MPLTKSSLEKFIGENLINKIGIIITVLGVGIGAKYSIDNGLISPLTLIVLCYLTGFGLLGFGMKLKTKIESYSAVLVIGAMAILYFITYLGYELYHLFPQLAAFGLMLVFTAFTVYAALNYNKQIIAILSLVGAYAVPFLLSSGFGRVDILFSYMALINIGILIIALKKYWKPLYYAAFGITWVMLLGWLLSNYNENSQFNLALLFLSIFYLIFYATFIGYKITHKKNFVRGDIVVLLLNSFLFYGIGFVLLKENNSTDHLLGIFTLINALIHFAISTLIYRIKLADKNIFYMISGLVLVFITIAIPVQLDGNWVTLLWVGEAAILFWIGRTKEVPIYETISYVLMLLATFSLYQDWSIFYSQFSYISEYEINNNLYQKTPVFNVQFLSSIFFIAGFTFINYISRKQEFITDDVKKNKFSKLSVFAIPSILIGGAFLAFYLEIAEYWHQTSYSTAVKSDMGNVQNIDLEYFKSIWLINYSMIFAALVSILNIKYLKNKEFAKINLVLNATIVLAFLTSGLFSISELRESYISSTESEFFNHGWFNLGIRYLSITLLCVFIFLCFKYIKQDFIEDNYRKIFDIVLHVSIVWVLSSELLSIMSVGGVANNYKLGLSILWGIYSLAIVAYGIWKNNAFLRIGAIILFAATLIKVFFYDISHLDTIAKTIVFVSLGALLLIISYLYNRFKNLITYQEDENIS